MITSVLGGKHVIKSLFIIAGLSVLQGCVGTSAPVVDLVDNTQSNYIRVDSACIAQVNQQQAALETAQPSQYLSLSNTANHCIQDIPFSPQHPDNQLAMQFNALAFMNFVKAGDMQAAAESLSQFRQRFPQQDLYFEDYSSFIDTAIALVDQHKLNQNQIKLLNINPQLRAEIRRQQKWSLN